MIAFSGVRNSWLMFARNSDFARLAASASSRGDAEIRDARALSSLPCRSSRSAGLQQLQHLVAHLFFAFAKSLLRARLYRHVGESFDRAAIRKRLVDDLDYAGRRHTAATACFGHRMQPDEAALPLVSRFRMRPIFVLRRTSASARFSAAPGPVSSSGRSNISTYWWFGQHHALVRVQQDKTLRHVFECNVEPIVGARQFSVGFAPATSLRAPARPHGVSGR